MKLSELVAVLEAVLEEKGDVEVAILDNDTEALLDVSRIGMASDGRLALYGPRSSAASYGRIVELMWWGQVRPDFSNVELIVVGRLTDEEE